MDGIEIALLGPLEVRRDRAVLPLAGVRLRRLLAVLAVHANEVVSVDAIVDAMWGEAPPVTATSALHVLVSRLRQTLEPERQGRSDDGVVMTVPPGYMLRVDRTDVDALCFEHDV